MEPLNERQMHDFRLGFHLKILELLCLKVYFLAAHVEGGLSIAQTSRGLKEWVDVNSAEVLRVFGALGDPAILSLYDAEAETVTIGLKRTIDRVSEEAMKAFGA